MISTIITGGLVSVGDNVTDGNIVGEIMNVYEVDNHDILLDVELDNGDALTLNSKDCRVLEGV